MTLNIRNFNGNKRKTTAVYLEGILIHFFTFYGTIQ